MAVTFSSNYAGEVLDEILSLMVTGNEAMEKGSINIISGIQQKVSLPRFVAAADALQARQATPTLPSSSFTWDERTITPLDAMFYDEVNPRTFEDVWRQWQPTGNLVDKVFDPDIQLAILSETTKSVNTQIGKLIWQGDTGGVTALSFFDGYVKLITADAASVKITPAGVITAANIISVLEATEAGIPDSIWDDPDVVFHMNTTDYRLYLEAARALDFKGSNITDAEDSRFASREIRFYSGMSKDSIIVAKATTGNDSNLHAAVDMLDDPETVKVERLQANSELFFVKVLFKMAVNTAFGEETVIYNPA